MLTGMVIWRDFSTGRAGIRPLISKGPNMPLVVQYSFCANAPDDAAINSMPSNAATMPDFFMVLIPPWNFRVVLCLYFSYPLAPPVTLYRPNFTSGREFFDFPAIAFRYLRYGATEVCPFRFNASLRV